MGRQAATPAISTPATLPRRQPPGGKPSPSCAPTASQAAAEARTQARQLMRQLSEQLLRYRYRVSCAESCTGGMLAQTLTALPGSSRWFEMGFVCYADRAKALLLGVPAGLLRQHGAVSEPVVRAMAEGAARRAGAHLAAAVSGIAGPEGGTEAKPVGTVWFGWAHRTSPREARTKARCLHFAGSREEVRARAVVAALEGLLSLLQEMPHKMEETR